ncbi:MAG: sel1 repeat family protein [Planctomycetaceae bacterium]|jgi:TPR repeat protein|nr:sel1 repeat family protein [Planctomycetaceae bacterium]
MKRTNFFLFIAAVAAAINFCAAVEAHEWETKLGHMFEAKFVKLSNGIVYLKPLKPQNGDEVEFKLDDLHASDQDYIKQISPPVAIEKEKQDAAATAATKIKIDWNTPPYRVLEAEAGKNNPDVLVWFAYTYETSGGDKKISKVKEYYQRGAQHPDTDSPAVQYCKGHYIDEEHSGSPTLLRKSAEQGFVLAQFELGTERKANHRYCKDVEWLTKAAEQGYIPALVVLGDYYAGRSTYVISEQSRKSSDYWRREFYELKSDNIRDANLALKYWQAAAKKGSAEALAKMGVLYTSGKHLGYNIETDLAEAMICFIKVNSIWMDVKDRGLTVQTDKRLGEIIRDENAIRKIRERADSGDADAQFALGWYYFLYEKNSEENNEIALTWLRKAAEQNNPQALYKLAQCYEGRTRIEMKNKTEAAHWYLKAAEQGYTPWSFSPSGYVGF